MGVIKYTNQNNLAALKFFDPKFKPKDPIITGVSFEDNGLVTSEDITSTIDGSTRTSTYPITPSITLTEYITQQETNDTPIVPDLLAALREKAKGGRTSNPADRFHSASTPSETNARNL